MTTKSTGSPQITVFRGWKASGSYVWSPYVTKIEFRLRAGGISYTTEEGSLSTAPKGKIPYISIVEADSTSTSLADSTLIIQSLVENGLLEDINSKLSPTEKASDLAFRALLEDKLYFYHTYERWVQNYYEMRGHILQSLPYPMQVLVGLIIYRKTTQTLHGQGTGRFSPEEIQSFRQQIWDNFDELLTLSKRKAQKSDNDSPFWVLGGDGPSEADMVLFSFIVSVLVCSAAPDSQKVVRSLPIVMEYANRIHNQYFPDYAHWD